MGITDQMLADAGVSPSSGFDSTKTYGTPSQLLDNLEMVESSGNPKAVNKQTGATGAYQFLPSTVQMLAKQGVNFDPTDAAQSRAAADYYINQLAQRHGGDYAKAMADYGGFKNSDPSSYVGKVMKGVDVASLGGPTPAVAPLVSTTSAPLSGLGAQMYADARQNSTSSTPQKDISAVSAPPSATDVGLALASQLNPMNAARGIGEFAAQTGSGTLASAAGGLKGLYDLATGQGVDKATKDIHDIQQQYTYQPTSQQGQAISSGVGQVMGAIKSGAGAVGGAVGNAVGGEKGRLIGQSISEITPDIAMTLGGGASLLKGGSSLSSLIDSKVPTLEDLQQLGSKPAAPEPAVLKPRYKLNTDGSYAPISDPNAPSPVAQQIQQLKSTLGANRPDLDPVSLQRHAEANTIGVPLTEGQASGDPIQISNEMNARSKNAALMNTFNAQNGQLINALDQVRAKAAPDVTAQGSDLGQQLVDAYKTQDAQARAVISANYKKLEDANGGQFPLSGTQFVDSATKALADKNVQRFLPAPVQGILSDLKNSGNMTFNDFENYRTILGQQERAADRAGDGTASYAIQTVRNALENLPMDGQAAGLKALADTARSSAAARFQAIKNDPAYKAVVNDDAGIGQASPLADKFIQNYVVNGKTANVARMYDTIGQDPQAVQALKAGVIDNLKSSSGVDLRTNTGNLSQGGLNKAIQNLGNKSRLILGDDADTVNTIGNVARYTQQQPRGSFVNNSNTFPAMVAGGAKNLAEGILNVKTGGAYSPLKNMLTLGKQTRELNRAANPITLKDLGQ